MDLTFNFLELIGYSLDHLKIKLSGPHISIVYIRKVVTWSNEIIGASRAIEGSAY
jgi:hypothetical protein